MGGDLMSTNGVYVASPTLGVAGLCGDADTAVTLNGSSQYINVDPAPTFSDVMTFSFWIKTTSVAGGYLFGADNGSLCAYMGEAGWVALARQSVADLAYTNTYAVNDGNAHHVVCCKNGADIRIYIDAVDRTTPIGNSTAAANTGALNVGRKRVGTSDYSAWTVDEFAIWNGRALSTAEIAALFASKAAGTWAATMLGLAPDLWLRCGEPSGIVAYDWGGAAKRMMLTKDGALTGQIAMGAGDALALSGTVEL
jgi:hypothetical protein